jgi:hypothetical protein
MCGGRVIGAQWYYEDGSWHFAPVRSEARMCVECVSDDDCAERKDGRVACLGPDGTCARCNGQDVSRCSAEKEGAACLRQGDCGCRTDADCAPDRQCVAERQRCEKRKPEPKPEASDRTRRGPSVMISEPLVTLDGSASSRSPMRRCCSSNTSEHSVNALGRASASRDERGADDAMDFA